MHYVGCKNGIVFKNVDERVKIELNELTFSQSVAMQKDDSTHDRHSCFLFIESEFYENGFLVRVSIDVKNCLQPYEKKRNFDFMLDATLYTYQDFIMHYVGCKNVIVLKNIDERVTIELKKLTYFPSFNHEKLWLITKHTTFNKNIFTYGCSDILK